MFYAVPHTTITRQKIKLKLPHSAKVEARLRIEKKIPEGWGFSREIAACMLYIYSVVLF